MTDHRGGWVGQGVQNKSLVQDGSVYILCAVTINVFSSHQPKKPISSHLKQAAVSHELKRWCMSLLKDMNTPKKAQYYKLLPSPSVERSGADADLESLPLLSVVSGDSSTSLATYVNIVPSESSGHNLGGLGQEQLRGRTYFEMRVDRSPGMSTNSSSC